MKQRHLARKSAPLAAAVIALVLAVLASSPTNTAERAWVTLLSTTDVHGNILPVDYYTDKADPRGLAKVASIVRQIRRENPAGTLLLSSGDTIQGTPLVYVHNRIGNASTDPMMLVMNAMGFDAMTVGNHEFNFGPVVFEKARREARFPWLAANVYNTGTEQTHFTPYIVKEVNGARIGVLGLITPGVPFWEDKKNYSGLTFRDTVSEARKWVDVLRTRERVDLIVVPMHMGLEEDVITGVADPGQVTDENAALAIARDVPGVDVILMGHTHRDVSALSVNGVLLTQASMWGRHLARVDVVLEKDSGRWRVAAKQARTIPIADSTPVDAEIAKLAEPYDRETRAWLGRPIGESSAELTVDLFRDTALIDLIQRAQMEEGHADVSMTAVFNPAARLRKGAVTVRDIASLYVYENTLVVIEVTGRQLKEALEHSARFFVTYVPGKTAAELVDRRVPTYNFDVAEGVDYTLDITKPAGQRIIDLRFRGQRVTPSQKFRLATNNYRVNGGGGYTMYAGAPELYRSSQEIRELIIEWVEKHHEVPASPTNNWRLISSTR